MVLAELTMVDQPSNSCILMSTPDSKHIIKRRKGFQKVHTLASSLPHLALLINGIVFFLKYCPLPLGYLYPGLETLSLNTNLSAVLPVRSSFCIVSVTGSENLITVLLAFFCYTGCFTQSHLFSIIIRESTGILIIVYSLHHSNAMINQHFHPFSIWKTILAKLLDFHLLFFSWSRI